MTAIDLEGNVYSYRASRGRREKVSARWNLPIRAIGTGIAHCKHGKSINNFRVVFLQRAAGIQMRPPPKYVDIMDINIFIWHTGAPALCAPINHAAVILITFRIESAFPMLPRRKSRFVCDGRCNIYRRYTVTRVWLHMCTRYIIRNHKFTKLREPVISFGSKKSIVTNGILQSDVVPKLGMLARCESAIVQPIRVTRRVSS
jgi:hypothetical protein